MGVDTEKAPGVLGLGPGRNASIAGLVLGMNYLFGEMSNL